MTIASSNGGGSPEQNLILKSAIDSTPDVRNIAAPVAGGPNDYIIWIGGVADGMLAWGMAPKQRDAQLRLFFPTENYLMSAITTIAARNAAFSWALDGPETLVEKAKEMLLNANRGLGWESWNTKLSIDVATQDSGGFTEIIRAKKDDPKSEVINFAHLDAQRCYPTGDPDSPVVFRDRLDRFHLLKWFQVYHHLESPSPVENYQGPLYGMQYCAVSRVLKAAQILKSIAIYQDEKLSGRNDAAIHLIRGIDVNKINDALQQNRALADNMGNTRYIRPAMVGSHNPEADVGHDTIELASLPANFDLEQTMKWYISALALAFHVDYQDFAPLPSGNLGSGAQSQVLHLKSRGKGPALWQKGIEHFMNHSGVLPEGVTFRFDEQDIEAETALQAIKFSRAQERAARIASTEIDAPAARSMALDDGDLTQEQYDELEKRAKEQEAQAAADAEEAKKLQMVDGGLAAEERTAKVELTRAQAANVGAAAGGGGRSDATSKDDRPTTASKERIPPGRLELEDAVADPIENIMSTTARRITRQIRGLAAEEKDIGPEGRTIRPTRILKTVTDTDKHGRPTQVLEEAIS